MNSKAAPQAPNSINGKWSITGGAAADLPINSEEDADMDFLSDFLAEIEANKEIANGCTKMDCEKHPHKKGE